MKNHFVKVLHTGISVSDMERSLKWYKDVLGFEECYKDDYVPPLGARICFIRGVGGYEIELFQYDAPKAIPEDRLKPNSDLQTIGTKHVAFQVSDMAGFKAKAVAYGVDIAHEVTMCGESVMFIRDPDGVLVELIQPPVC
jgi:catechol 2,3-dioxygenase-like lactoylglutathione lyase family enzyme